MKKRNKAYRPKPVKVHAAFQALAQPFTRAEDKRPLAADQVTDLGIAYRVALDQLRAGKGDEQDWSTVVCSLNIALVLDEMVFCGRYESVMVDALEGAFRAKVRAEKLGKWGFDGEALAGILYALDIHDSQLGLANKQEVREALAEVHRRMDAGIFYERAAA